jgi:AcrR family transcriptional regulator
MAPDSAATKPLFPRLSGGPSGMAPEQVAAHQRARLEGAMVEAVARHGFAGTTLRELVTLAGVSKTTFYQHFESKQDCFLATFDEVARQTRERVGEAYREPDDFHDKFVAGLSTFMQMAAEQPAAASLAMVESLTLGTAGVEHWWRASQDFELMIQQSFDYSPAPRAVSALTVRAIVGGIRGVIYRRLRAGREDELPGLVEPLVEWAVLFQQPDSEIVLRAREAAARPPRELGEDRGESEPRPAWSEPPDSRLSRRTLSQRDRIVRGAAQVVAAKGYEALSIPAISATAGVSNQTFYEHFSGKRDAFVAAFQTLAEETLAVGARAFAAENDRPEAVGAGLRALLEEIAANEIFARIAFFEIPTAGPAALDKADAVLDSITAFLDPAIEPGTLGKQLDEPILSAISTGVWAALQHEIVNGRLASLPQLAPDVARLALQPLSPGE